MRDWNGTRILIIGAARQGKALARYLTRKGADVILNDMLPADKLAGIESEMNKIGVKCVFGGHPLDLLNGIQLVSISGGIPLDNPLVREAVRLRIPVTNDSQIFMEEVKAPIIAVTGSAGKSTTTALIGRMANLSLRKPHTAWVGGNIGIPLVEKLDEIKPGDLVILELSSFQLEQMTISPHIAAVLNITPNHLDRHETMAAYTAAKERILTFQNSSDTAVLNREDPGSWNLREKVKGQLFTFGHSRPEPGINGTFIDPDDISCAADRKTVKLCSRHSIHLRGDHNLMNVLAACAIGCAAGFKPAAMKKAVADFHGMAHRLEFVRQWHGAVWFNDSIATAPERTIAAIRSFDEPLVLLLGGRDKNLPWESLADLVHERVRHVIVFGEAAGKIVEALSSANPQEKKATIQKVDKLKDAIDAASQIVEPGDVVLLSPGGTSFDEFKDFEERGEYFEMGESKLQ